MPNQSPTHVISRRIEPYQLRHRLVGKLLWLRAWPALLVAMRRRSGRTEIWIGDSHAMSVNRPATNSNFMCAPEGQLIVRAGARLMYSLGCDGFPPRVMRVARLVNRLGRPGALVPIFCAGEIDVRVHLPKRPETSFGWVVDYVNRCMEVARLLKADRVGFFVPTPPVDVAPDDVWFPVTGAIETRVAVHRKLREALAGAVDTVPGAVLLDFTDLLAGSIGAMPVELTTDGAHANSHAVARIREQIRDHRLFA